MPIMDDQLIICESTSIAATAGDHVHLTDIVYLPQVYDYKKAAMDDYPNISGRLYWNIVVEDEDMLGAADSATVTFYLYNGDTGTNPLIDNGGVVIDSYAMSQGLTTATKDGSLILSRAIPVGQLHPYFDLYVTVATQNLSTGKITCWLGGPVQGGKLP